MTESGLCHGNTILYLRDSEDPCTGNAKNSIFSYVMKCSSTICERRAEMFSWMNLDCFHSLYLWELSDVSGWLLRKRTTQESLGSWTGCVTHESDRLATRA